MVVGEMVELLLAELEAERLGLGRLVRLRLGVEVEVPLAVGDREELRQALSVEEELNVVLMEGVGEGNDETVGLAFPEALGVDVCDALEEGGGEREPDKEAMLKVDLEGLAVTLGDGVALDEVLTVPESEPVGKVVPEWAWDGELAPERVRLPDAQKDTVGDFVEEEQLEALMEGVNVGD